MSEARELRERVARTLMASLYARDVWNSVPQSERDIYLLHADAAIALALEEAARCAERLAPYTERGLDSAAMTYIAENIAAAIRALATASARTDS